MGITHYVRNTRKRKVLTYPKKKSDCACTTNVTGENKKRGWAIGWTGEQKKMATLSTQDLRWAQKDIYNAGKSLASAGLRLQGSEYEDAYRRLYKALEALNRSLIKDIQKRK